MSTKTSQQLPTRNRRFSASLTSGKHAMAIALALACGAPAWAEGPSSASGAGWNVTENQEALTGATTVAAALDADGPVLNMLGAPENPTLVLRCKERSLVAYIAWPQVLNSDFNGFNGSETTISWRIDDQPIVTELWPTSDDGTAAGRFDTKTAARFLGKLIAGRRLAVRLTGSNTQDAAFTLSNVKAVAARVAQPCGVTL